MTDDEKYSAMETLRLLKDGGFNFDRPDSTILKEFGELLVFLANRINQR